ncbi:type III secretion system protein [Ideonella sp. YS5]|uniref:type III secretion system protein n=1 Tax=Ideonella sp. YS5 TaxID=3453714 RepID=UPI003EE9856D
MTTAALRARLRAATRPSLDAHASWWPPGWREHGPIRLGEGGHQAASTWLRRTHAVPDAAEAATRPDSPVERLAWMDGRSLRRLALVAGFVAHRDHFETPGLALEMWRQAKRLDRGLPDFALSHWPSCPALAMSPRALVQRPRAAGRVVLRRGYQLMLGLLASEGQGLWRSTRIRFPRSVAQAGPPAMPPERRQVYEELLFMCALPERFGSWDWLF